MKTLEQRLAHLVLSRDDLEDSLARVRDEISRVEREILEGQKAAQTAAVFEDTFGRVDGALRLTLVLKVAQRIAAVKRLRESNSTRNAAWTVQRAAEGTLGDRRGQDRTAAQKWHTVAVALRVIMSEDHADKSVELRAEAEEASAAALRAVRAEFGFDMVCGQCGHDWKSAEDDDCPTCAKWEARRAAQA